MTKIASAALGLLAGLLAAQGTTDFAGTWNTVAKPKSPLMKTVYEPTFEFKVDGENLTGMAYMGGWPGDGTISDGKVVGNRIAFTLTHERTYTMNAGTFHPTLRCTGTVHGNELDLTMVSLHPGFVNPELIGTKPRK